MVSSGSQQIINIFIKFEKLYSNMKSTKPYTIIGIIFFLIPVLIYIIYGNIFNYSDACQSEGQVIILGNTVSCLFVRFLMVFIPVCFIIGFVFLIYASMKRVKKS